MKIDSIYIEPFKTTFLEPFQAANKKYNFRKGWYLKIQSEKIIGIGEISPLQNYSPDYKLPVEKKINELIKNIKLNNNNIDKVKKLIKNSLKDFPSIQFGIETAIYDLLSKKNNLPLSKYWNLKSTNKLNYNSIINMNSSLSNLSNIVKIKIISKSIKKNKLFFDKIFKKKSNIKLRLDFNGTLNLKDAKKWIKELSNFEIDYIEQPLPADQLAELSELRSYSNIPIAVDESITNLESAYKIIDNKSADVFIIKPMISGGYKNSKKIVELANKNNIRSVITTSLETEIGFLANFHIACALNISEYCGFSTWNIFTNKPPKYIKKNYITLSNKPGLGN